MQSPELPATVVLPTVAASSTTAVLGGNVTSDGNTPLTIVGVVYSPTTTNNYPMQGGAGVVEVDSGVLATGVFTVNASGLTPNTNYTMRAFAINGYGGQLCTTYSTPAEFTTLS